MALGKTPRPDFPTSAGGPVLDSMCTRLNGEIYSLDFTFVDRHSPLERASTHIDLDTGLDGIQVESMIPGTTTGYLRNITPKDIFECMAQAYNFELAWKAMRAQSTRPRIAFTVLSGSIKGGGSIVLYKFCTWLTQLGFEVSIYADDSPPTWIDMPCRYHSEPDPVKRYRRIGEDIIIAYSLYELRPLLALVAKSKVVLHLCQGLEHLHYREGLDRRKTFLDFAKILYSLPVGRIVTSPHLRDYFRQEHHQDCFFIPNGINTELFRFSPKVAAPGKTKRILTVGNPRHFLKNFEAVARATALLAKRRPRWKLSLITVCGGSYKPDKRYSKLGFEYQCLSGLSDMEIQEQYHRADILVNASLYEGFGLPSLEAMACGTPVVQGDNQGLSGIAQHEFNCLIVPPNSEEAIADAIERLLCDADLRATLVRNGCETARNYSTEAQFEHFSLAFSEILGAHFQAGRAITLHDAPQMPSIIESSQPITDSNQDSTRAPSSQLSSPFFSILVPTYNQAHFLPAALDSLILQTYKEWEAIVVDDGSTDETTTILKQYQTRDSRFRVVSKSNGGVASALNAALKQANGQWICWLSSDDQFEPEKLAIHLECIVQHPELRFHYTGYKVLDDLTGTLYQAELQRPESAQSQQTQLIRLFDHNFINGISIAIHRSAFADSGYFDEANRAGQDFDMWLRMAAKHRFHYIHRHTCITHVYADQPTQKAPMRGIIDSGRVCLDFLNRHCFEALFPFTDLNTREGRQLALGSVLGVLFNPQSYVNLCGFESALMERTIEWLRGDRDTILVACLKQMLDSTAPDAELQFHVLRCLHQGLTDFSGYKPKDGFTLLQAKVNSLEHASGKSHATGIHQYLQEHADSKASANFSPSPYPKNHPRFSIIVPTYNQAAFLKRAIQSVVCQGRSDWEMVIVNDGSTDETAIVVEDFAKIDSRVRPFHQPNGGVGSALNMALRQARGDWICWLSSDDQLEPDALKIFADAISANPDASFIHSEYSELVHETGEKRAGIPGRASWIPIPAYQTLQFMLGNYIHGISICVRKSLFEQAGGFKPELKYAQDMDMWLRLSALTPFLFLERRTCVTGIHSGQGTVGFPEACTLDSTRACLDFLNLNRFPRLFAHLDLKTEDGSIQAASAALAVASNLQAVMYAGIGPVPALLERLGEWLQQDCPVSFRPKVLATLSQAAKSLPLLPLELKGILERILSGQEVRYSHKDTIALLRSQCRMAEAKGVSATATTLRRYLDKVVDAPEAAESAKAVTQTPLVSVIVPTHNRPHFLARNLASLESQTYPRMEIIVVNDGGSSVQNVIERCSRPVTYLCHGENLGRSAARNNALKISRGEILVYLDDDDVFLPDHIETIVQGIRQSRADFVYTDTVYVTEREVGGEWMGISTSPSPYSEIPYSKEHLHVENFIPINTWGHTREVLEKVGYFDHSMDLFEDWEFLIRMSRCFSNVAHIHKVTTEVHVREGGDNTITRERHRFRETYELIYSRYDDLGSPEVRDGRMRVLRSLVDSAPIQVEAQVAVFQPIGDLYILWRQRQETICARSGAAQEVGGNCRFYVFAAQEHVPLLADTLDSFSNSLAQAWSLTVVSDAPCPDPLFDELMNLHWDTAERQKFSAALNSAATVDNEDWMIFVPCGAILQPDLLIRLQEYASRYNNTVLFYADSERQESDQLVPCLRPDFNLDLLRSTAFLGGLLAIRREAFGVVGGFREGTDQCLYDLVLRIAEHYGESVIGHIDSNLYREPLTKQPASEELSKAIIAGHLQRCSLQGFVVPGFSPGCLRTTYVHSATPKVSIILSTKDHHQLLRDCADSILGKTNYPNFELVIVDNQSKQQDALDLLHELEGSESGRVQVFKYAKPFNHAAMRNLGAKAARGEYLLFLDNDTQVLQKEWLHLLMYQAQRPEIGIVGPRLVYPGVPARIQHAGVVLGLGGVADHPYMGLLGLEDPGYMNRAQVDQELSAVCGSCLLIRKSVFDEVGGMDESVFRNVMSPIDLCLKVRTKGYKVLWTPYVTLLHHGSATRNAEAKNPTKAKEAQENLEAEYEGMLKKWLPQLARDPFYNRNLSLLHRDYRVEADFIVPWDPRIPSDRTRILGWTLDGAPCEYRVKIPLQALNEAGATETGIIYPPGPGLIRSVLLTEIVRANPDIFTTSVFLGMHEHIPMLKQLKKFTEIPVVMQLDDITTAVPKGSHAYSQRHTPGHLKKLLSFADRVVVTTRPIADYVKGLCGDVMLIPNYLPRFLWEGKVSQRRQGKKPRVGWAGAMQHGGDLALITEVVKATAEEVDWVFFGMCPEGLTGLIREFYPFGPFEAYPTILASLNLDLAIAPLENNKFNEGKSNLRLLEYGFLGWPVVCSDVPPYRDAPVKRVSDKASAWIEAIRERVNDLDAAEREGQELQRWVLEGWMLEDHLEEWAKAYSFGV